MNLGSVCRADRAQSNGPTLRPLANFHIELEQFAVQLRRLKPVYEHSAFQINYGLRKQFTLFLEVTYGPKFFLCRSRRGSKNMLGA